jgi:tripartite ATP-independent transporter DctM subunit
MSPETVGLLGIIVLLILIVLKMNIGLCMAAVGFFGFCFISGFESGIAMIGTTAYNTVASYSITVIPLFILMGAVISNSGLGEHLYKAAYVWVGHLRGGLAIATIAACAIFAAMCGSSMAEAVTIGRIALPEMRKYRYSDAMATGCVACAGSLAMLIPPSVGFLVYGILTEQSIGLLFIAGVIPGIILAILFAITVLVLTWINPKAGPAGERSSWRERGVMLKIIGPVGALLLLVLGGIYGGFFTPTEAGGVGAFGAIVITAVSGYLDRKKFLDSIIEAGTTTAMILLLMMGAFIFTKFMAVSQLTVWLPEFIKGLGVSPYMTLLAIIIFYILLGMFFDILAGMVLTIPLIYPLIVSLGFDPIWFGVLLVVLQEMGVATPPIGMNVFLLSAVTDVPMETMFKGVWPFIGAIIVFVVILILFPQLALWLPSGMMAQ